VLVVLVALSRGVVVLVALSRGVVVLISDGSGFWSAYMLICLPGSNDN